MLAIGFMIIFQVDHVFCLIHFLAHVSEYCGAFNSTSLFENVHYLMFFSRGHVLIGFFLM